MPASTTGGREGLTRALSFVVILLMLLAVVYATWISLSNFSRIGV